MKKFKNILFPVDLSESSNIIVSYVKGVGEAFASKIHLLFVARVLQYFTDVYVPAPSIIQFENEIINGAQKRLHEFAGEHFKTYKDVQTTVVSGDPAEQILNYIIEQHIDLVIMGTHGRKGVEKILFGSVADRVVKTSQVPVMVVNPNIKKT